MFDATILLDWLQFLVRWTHVIVGIAWIGSSFYFIALDLGLKNPGNLPAGVGGEEWQVHGGGFYRMQKYTVAPPELPEHLTWFKWESYSTWLSGFAMLILVYYLGADLFLVDKAVLDVPAWGGILISLGSIGIGWVIYDLLCRSPLGKSTTGLMVLLFIVLVAMAWGYTQVFTGRAALLHLGAFTATIMSANVFFVIIPNQKIAVGQMKAGQAPDPMLGKQAKQRSLHNNYLTLPVLFLMLSTHYPLAFATPYNWVIASLIFLIGVLVRHFFNPHHAGKGDPWWTFVLAAIVFVVMIWLSSIPAPVAEEMDVSENAFTSASQYADVEGTILGRCAMCHTAEPYYEGVMRAPKGVHLDTTERIVAHAREIVVQAGLSHAMPPANVTEITPEERALLVDWYRTATGGRS